MNKILQVTEYEDKFVFLYSFVSKRKDYEENGFKRETFDKNIDLEKKINSFIKKGFTVNRVKGLSI